MLGRAQRGEGLDHGHVLVPRHRERGQAAGPEPGVRHVGPVPAPAVGQPVGELPDVLAQLVSGQLGRGSRGQVLDRHAGFQRDRGRLPLPAPAGVDGDPVTLGGHRVREAEGPAVGQARSGGGLEGGLGGAVAERDERDLQHGVPSVGPPPGGASAQPMRAAEGTKKGLTKHNYAVAPGGAAVCLLRKHRCSSYHEGRLISRPQPRLACRRAATRPPSAGPPPLPGPGRDPRPAPAARRCPRREPRGRHGRRSGWCRRSGRR